MSVTSPQFYAQTILCISREMYGCAKQGDWAAFTDLEAKRQEMITSLFNYPHINKVLEKLASTLNEVMAIDNKSILLGEKEKQHLAEEISGLKQHHQAARIYQFVSMN